jgi:copper chaperone CopZ
VRISKFCKSSSLLVNQTEFKLKGVGFIMDKNCHVDYLDKERISDNAEEATTIALIVLGMGCINCANRVHNKLISHPAVLEAEVSHVTGTAEISYIPSQVTLEGLVALVADAGDERHRYTALIPLY